jgi:energy-coupling factor transport system substrate-specific component
MSNSSVRQATSGVSALRWRVVDIVVTAVIGVAAGVVFFGWNLVYSPLTAPIEAALPGLQALVYGVWLFAGVLAGLVVRKPGAAVLAEVIAASVSAMFGASWGLLTIEAGIVQGLGAELILAIFLYRRFGPVVALLAGAAAGLAMGVNDLILWYAGAGAAFATIYVTSAVISGAVIAGLGSWALARALAATGVLSRFASGRDVAVKV